MKSLSLSSSYRTRANGRACLFLMALPLFLCLLNGCRSGPKFTAESRIKQLGQLLTITVTQNLSVYPDMSSPAALKTALNPVIASRATGDDASFWRNEIFIDPQSGEPFVPNAHLSKVHFSTIDGHGLADKTITVYAPRPTDGERLVVFADGHAAWVNEKVWSPQLLAVPGATGAVPAN